MTWSVINNILLNEGMEVGETPSIRHTIINTHSHDVVKVRFII